jgi:hypothetical protein
MAMVPLPVSSAYSLGSSLGSTLLLTRILQSSRWGAPKSLSASRTERWGGTSLSSPLTKTLTIIPFPPPP